MFSNKLIKSLCSSSDEENLRLSEADWKIVLEANKGFSETEDDFRGSALWGWYLLRKIGQYGRCIGVSSSLELCCGNGFLYFSFRDIVKPAGNRSYVDISSNQCESFRNRCDEIELKDLDIYCADIGTLPFPDNSLKLVYGNSFLHHLPDVEKYLTEANRVLEKGGKFIVFHEPSLTATFWESFPISLYKDTRTDSLTDIWNISPIVIQRLLRKAGFMFVEIMPRELLASLLVTPIQIVTRKISHRAANSNVFVILRMFCYWLDLLVPKQLRIKYSPSLAIYAKK